MVDRASAAKSCVRCGRKITWRKKWAANWESVRYCSERCRRTKLSEHDTELEAVILSLLGQRARGSSICSSEAARAVFSADSWRADMEATRQAARRLVAAGKIDMLQRGAVVDPSSAKGPVRLRLR